MVMRLSVVAPALLVLAAHAANAATDPWADRVDFYEPGIGAAPGYNNPNVALGSPERFTGEGIFPGAVTPFNSPYGTDEVVSIGAGGSLILTFNEPVTNDPANPFGIDLLVFGNSFFWDPVTFAPVAVALASEGGVIEVSQDGTSWTLVPNVLADGLFPTLGYNDPSDPFGGPAGSQPTDFTRPVNPAFAWQGSDLAGLIAGYNGSGGGAGVDLGAVGLPWITSIRFSLPAGVAGKFEIDAVSDVSPIPAPGLTALALPAFLLASRRRRV